MRVENETLIFDNKEERKGKLLFDLTLYYPGARRCTFRYVPNSMMDVIIELAMKNKAIIKVENVREV